MAQRTADTLESRPPTAQRVFEQMMRTEVAPALRRAGFTGTFRDFRITSGDHRGYVYAQKSRYSTKECVDFRMMVAAPCMGGKQLFALMPAQEFPESGFWEVLAGKPTAAIAAVVVSAVRRYALPAIRAALDDPGHQLDPAVQWARRIPSVPGPFDHAADGHGVDPGAWYVQPDGTVTDRLFAALTSAYPHDRYDALKAIGQGAMGDRRAVPALLERLEHEPQQLTRRSIACARLLPVAHDPAVGAALSAAAAEDEDVEVRWAARFALLFDPRVT
ncbi:MAG: hypothetical protein ACLQFR_25500 [Streptosporangiaceae bacterium]